MAITGVQADIVAHRGWHADGALENSIAALDEAVLGGADQIEIDVQRMSDDTLIVFHDGRLDGKPLHTLDRSALVAHPEIPLLEDWARRAGTSDIKVLTELKGHGHEAATAATLRRYIPEERLSWMSFEPKAVRALRELAPEGAVGLLTYDMPVTNAVRQLLAPGSLARRAQQHGASFLGLNAAQATPRVLAASSRAGLGVAVWTVDDAARMAVLLADSRVGALITDAPMMALSLRQALQGAEGAGAGVRLLRAATQLR